VYSSPLRFSYVVVRQFTGSQEVLKRLKLRDASSNGLTVTKKKKKNDRSRPCLVP
jgi:hypothetical protein